MHEMGIAMQIVDIAKASIPETLKHKKLERINIDVGKLSAIIPENLKFCFEVSVKNTPFEDTELIITEIPVIVQCNDCSKIWEVTSADYTCIYCGSSSLKYLSGEGMKVKSVELED
jgi:hydrogenase nickel incorporation protein HypA/HybF